MTGNKIANISLISILIMSLTGMAFAESHNNNTTVDQNSTVTDQQSSNENNQNKTEGEHQSEYDQQSSNENNQNKTEGEHQSEYDQQSSNENNQNKTEEENQTQSNQEGIDEINNQNNNEKATHQENQHDANDIQDAIGNKTVAAEVNIGGGNEEIKPLDNNIDVHTSNSTNDAVSVTVDSKSESGPKVIILNLNSTTIDVANVKYMHITYDGHSIAPATDVNSVLHPKSTDEPTYAIIVTQNGAKILVSIPHFSTHTITLSNISKVITPVPEFPIALLTLVAALIPIVFLSRKVSIWNKMTS